MKKKIFGGIAIVAIAAVAAFNVNLSKQSNGLSGISLANVEALADGDQNQSKTCGEDSKYGNNKEMCSTNPVKYVTKTGITYSKKKEGSLTSYRDGFEGTIYNECAPFNQETKYTATTKNCN
jgi:hypothetical protein